MALFMPTNITPSTLGALGNGTVDASQNMTVTWQVDGQNAMTAFEIKILANTAESAQLYDSGKRTDNCPFYGRNAKGDVVFSATRSRRRRWLQRESPTGTATSCSSPSGGQTRTA